MFETWREVFQNAFYNVGQGVINFLPNFIVAVVIFILGWIVGALVGHGVRHLVQLLRINDVFKNTEVERVVSRAGYRLDIGALLGGLVKWFVIVVFLVAALDVLGLAVVNDFLRNVVLTYLPQVIVAVLILVVAAVLADVMERVVEASSRAANLRHAEFLGTVTRWAIWVMAVLVALDQLGIGTTYIPTLFTGIVIALSLALGLAFGLGGQDAARDYINRVRREFPKGEE